MISKCHNRRRGQEYGHKLFLTLNWLSIHINWITLWCKFYQLIAKDWNNFKYNINRWTMQLFVMPSKQIYTTAAVLGSTCVGLAFIVAGLLWKEAVRTFTLTFILNGVLKIYWNVFRKKTRLRRNRNLTDLTLMQCSH